MFRLKVKQNTALSARWSTGHNTGSILSLVHSSWTSSCPAVKEKKKSSHAPSAAAAWCQQAERLALDEKKISPPSVMELTERVSREVDDTKTKPRSCSSSSPSSATQSPPGSAPCPFTPVRHVYLLHPARCGVSHPPANICNRTRTFTALCKKTGWHSSEAVATVEESDVRKV